MAEKKAPPVVVGGALKLKGAPAGVHKAYAGRQRELHKRES